MLPASAVPDGAAPGIWFARCADSGAGGANLARIKVIHVAGTTGKIKSIAKETVKRSGTWPRLEMVTMDLIGGCGGDSCGGDEVVDLEVKVPVGWERRLDLLSSKAFLTPPCCRRDSSATSPSPPQALSSASHVQLLLCSENDDQHFCSAISERKKDIHVISLSWITTGEGAAEFRGRRQGTPAKLLAQTFRR